MEIRNFYQAIRDNLVCKKCLERTRGKRIERFIKYCVDEELIEDRNKGSQNILQQQVGSSGMMVLAVEDS